MVWWCDQPGGLWLFELTVSYESHVANARGRKRAKYHDLVVAGKAAGYATKLITLEVGSRGMANIADFSGLQEAVDAPEIDCALPANNPESHLGLLFHLGLKESHSLTIFLYIYMYYFVGPDKCMPQ